MLLKIFSFLSIFFQMARIKFLKFFGGDSSSRPDEGLNSVLFTEKEKQIETFDKNKHESVIIFGSSNEAHLYMEFSVKRDKMTHVVSLSIDSKQFTSVKCVDADPSTLQTDTIIKIGGLRIELREPFRRWRVNFRGIMTDADGSEVFVKIQGWWMCVSDPDFYLHNLPSWDLCKLDCHSVSKKHDFIQWGMFRTRIQIEDQKATLDLRGARIRTLEDPRTDFRMVDFVVKYFDNGYRHFFFEVGNASNSFKYHLRFDGNHSQHFTKINHESFNFLNTPIELDSKVFELPDQNVFLLTEDIKEGEIGGKLTARSVKTKASKIQKDPAKVDQNGNVMISVVEYSNEQPNLLHFSNAYCKNSRITGGKGSNLAILDSLSKSKETAFTVPSGFVVTVDAYSKHLEQNCRLQSAIESIHMVKELGKEKLGDLQNLISAEFSNTTMSPLLKAEIEEELDKILHSSRTTTTLFAVRSSAVGEDGADFSSAGQLETYLNVQKEKVSRCIIDCWASNFRKEILAYRLERGNELCPPMAVVVQQMATAQTSGVMFTNDPLSGDPRKVVINMVEGLADQLVSGEVTPTQITVDKESLAISTEGNDELNDYSLDSIEKLAKVGIFLELNFGNAQDIEFVVNEENEISIVQARPITNLDLESEWELFHEFDVGTLTRNDVLSTANVGEVLPEAQCPLHLSIFNLSMSRSIQKLINTQSFSKTPEFRHFSKSMIIYRQRTLVNLSEVYLSDWQSFERDYIPEYSLAGTRLFTPEMFATAKQRYPPKSNFVNLFRLSKALKLLFFDSKKLLKEGNAMMKELTAIQPREYESPSDLLKNINRQCNLLEKILIIHATETAFSSTTYTFIAMILRGDSKASDFNSDLVSDISTIYSNNPLEIVSGELPKSLEKLAIQIRKDGHEEDFLNFDEDSHNKVIKWLMGLKDGTGQKMREFLTNYGHRGINELELLGTTWDSDPRLLVDTLKSVLMHKNDIGNDCNDSLPLTVDDIIGRLKSELNLKQRYALKLLVGHAHRGVWTREETKNFLVESIYALRHSFKLLGKSFHKMHLLPDPNLIFFMTLYEIEQIIHGREVAQKVVLSTRRRKLLEAQNSQSYPLVMTGFPDENKTLVDPIFANTIDGSLILKGTTVCEGTVVGRARVVKHIDDVKFVQPGEILITRQTDIGYSPLFPIVHGLVTEIGGLLSHGAVVAREYGLPCLIAVQNATDHFGTGDLVILDATRGIIQLKDRREN